MTLAVSDTFTDTNGTLITAHVGGVGASWTKFSGTATPTIQSNRVRAASIAYDPITCYASGVPDLEEYDVQAVLRFTGALSDHYLGIFGRFNTANGHRYEVKYESYSGFLRWNLVRIDGGGETSLATYAQTIVADTDYTVKLVIRNGYKKVFIDGVERISSTDNVLTNVGRAGISFIGDTDVDAWWDTLEVNSVGARANTLHDKLTDNDLDTDLWDVQIDQTGTVLEQNNRVELTVASLGWARLKSDAKYNLKDSIVQARVDFLSLSANTYFEFTVSDLTRRYCWRVFSGVIVGWTGAADFTGESAVTGSDTADADFRWLRFRESGGTLYYDRAPDGDTPDVPGEWVNFGSSVMATDNATFDPENVKVDFTYSYLGGAYDTVLISYVNNAKLETLQDAFTGEELDTNKWERVGITGHAGVQLRQKLELSTRNTGSLSQIKALENFNASNSSAYFRVASTTGNAILHCHVLSSSVNGYSIRLSNTLITCDRYDASVNTNFGGSHAFEPPTNNWIRLRFSQTHFFLDLAPDGIDETVPGTWANIVTDPISNCPAFVPGDTELILVQYHSGGATFARHDITGFNIAATPVAPTRYIVDNEDASPDWAEESPGGYEGWGGNDNKYGATYRYALSTVFYPAGAWFEWKFGPDSVGALTPDMTYEVSISWVSDPNRANDIGWEIIDSDGTTVLASGIIDQQIDPSEILDDSVYFDVLDSVAISGDNLTVRITATATGYMIADAVRIVEAAPTTATGYDVSGPTSGLVGVPQLYTFTPNGPDATETVTLGTTYDGTWAPTTITFDGTITPQEAYYTPNGTTGAPHLLSFVNDGDLDDPPNISFNVLLPDSGGDDGGGMRGGFDN